MSDSFPVAISTVTRIADHMLVFLMCSQVRNKEQEAEVLQWIFDVLGEPLPAGQYEDILKDGVVLCNLINKLAPGSVKKIQTKGTNFQLMENIQRQGIFVTAPIVIFI